MGISPINRDAIYRTHSPSLDISQYMADIQQTQITNENAFGFALQLGGRVA